MSNVLIGIIGVILFIGLALAGALILGEDFKAASTDSKAAIVQQQLKQVADAVSMANLKLGATPQSQFVDSNSALMPRFLKTLPVNPVRDGTTTVLIDVGGAVRPGLVAKTAIMYLNADSISQKICESIDRYSGRTKDNQTFDASAKSFAYDQIDGQSGCMSNGTVFIAFHKI